MYWPRLGTALLIAAHVWGAPPCGIPNVAYAEQPTDLEVTASAWTRPEDCTIYLANGILWSRWPAYRCAVIVHEWGHLAGQKHSGDRRNVMYSPVRRYWRCDQRAPAALRGYPGVLDVPFS